MEDILLSRFFDPEGLETAIDKAVDKDIKRSELVALCNKERLKKLAAELYYGTFEITPPHTAKIPKEGKDEWRTVYVNKPLERVVLSRVNDLLFELCPEFVHNACTSYQKGIGCGMVVKDVVVWLKDAMKYGVPAYKGDLSKYFDSVPREYIMEVFDRVEAKLGHSCIIDMLRKYYNLDLYWDSERKEYIKKDQSLKQGCAVAAFLADAILYDADRRISELDVHFVRYSDDFLVIGSDADNGMAIMEEELGKRQMKLNPKKLEVLSRDHWFKFLGFSLKGDDISLSSSRIKKFQKMIDDALDADKPLTEEQAVGRVMRAVYGYGNRYCWATQVLPIVNVKRDVNKLNGYAMDAIRAAVTGHKKIGGLGFLVAQHGGCIDRGRGRNVSANKRKVPMLSGYVPLGAAQNAIRTNMSAYYSLVSNPD